MLPLTALLLILTAHWIADFIFQSDEVGRNKSKSLKVLSDHVFTYTFVMFIACLPLFYLYNINYTNYTSFILLNGALHWVVDYVTSKLRAKVYNPDNAHMFFVLVGLDQLIHTAILSYTLLLLLNL